MTLKTEGETCGPLLWDWAARDACRDLRASSSVWEKALQSFQNQSIPCLCLPKCVYTITERETWRRKQSEDLCEMKVTESCPFFCFPSSLCILQYERLTFILFMGNFQLGACTSRYFRIHLILFANYICYRKFGIGEKRNQLFLFVV